MLFLEKRSQGYLKMKKIFITTFFIYYLIIQNIELKANRFIDTIFGEILIKDQLIEQIIDSQAFQRLKHVDQSGTLYYLGHVPRYNRYSHSLGVYALLKLYKAPFKEQVAGLLHDVSHTTFSHVADFLFKNSSYQNCYQDDIHEWFLNQVDIKKILEDFNIKINDINIKKNDFPALEQELPSVCADRIEYNLHTGLILGLIKNSEIRQIVKDLRYQDNKWYFINVSCAKKLGYLSLDLTEKIFGAPWNYVIYAWSAELLKRALDLNLISLHQIHFGKDQDIFKILEDSKDQKIISLLYKCKNPKKFYKIIENGHFDILIHPKFRGLDPLILIDGKYVSLSRLDKRFKKEYERVKNLMVRGIKLKIIDFKKNS